ncbi:MAG: class I SAM-dependent methyltransferase [Synechococcales cyanobacterium]
MSIPTTESVRQHYNVFPFPPDPLASVPPPGWNWRWSWPQAYHFCTHTHPGSRTVRILDAGCGSGVSTEYIAHQNPTADLWAFDISDTALGIAQARCQKSGAPPVNFRHCNIYDLDESAIPGTFDFINSVGMLHHLPDPVKGLQILADKLAPGGLIHIFIYGEIGRYPIRLMQEAIRLLVTGDPDQSLRNEEELRQGLATGRSLFRLLPEQNPIALQEKARWATENVDDGCFADMYLHPHEIDYTIPMLFDLVQQSGLTFLGFSNPEFWRLERFFSHEPQLLARARTLPLAQQYRLIEVLDAQVAHYEFYVGKLPLPRLDWTDAALTQAIAHRSPCIGRWPSQSIFNYAYQAIHLSEPDYQFLQHSDGQRTVAEIQAALSHPLPVEAIFALMEQGLLLLQPS